MSRQKIHVRKGDQVEVIAGAHKGAKGAVKEVFPTKSVATVEGIRLITKATRAKQGNDGGLIKKEGPIHTSNLKVVGGEKAAPAKKAAKKAAKKK